MGNGTKQREAEFGLKREKTHLKPNVRERERERERTVALCMIEKRFIYFKTQGP